MVNYILPGTESLGKNYSASFMTCTITTSEITGKDISIKIKIPWTKNYDVTSCNKFFVNPKAMEQLNKCIPSLPSIIKSACDTSLKKMGREWIDDGVSADKLMKSITRIDCLVEDPYNDGCVTICVYGDLFWSGHGADIMAKNGKLVDVDMGGSFV